MLNAEFHKNPMNGRRDKPRRYCVLQVRCPSLFTDCDQTYTFIGHLGSLLDMEFHENPMSGRRDRAKEVFCSSSPVPFIIDRSQSNLQQLSSMGADC